MRKLRRILLIALTLVVSCQLLLAEVVRHQVRPGDTLYSIAKRYGVTVEAIQAANPIVHGTNIPAGSWLVIPEACETPSAAAEQRPVMQEKQEKQLTPVQGIVVPNYQYAWEEQGNHWTDGTLTLAVILPFNLEATTPEQNKVQMRSVEFYQGLLMAVDDIQQSGRRVAVQAYDLGTLSMSQILENPQLLRADLIFAPMDESDVRPVAEWGELHETPVVSPFVFNAEMVEEFGQLFQVNTQKSMLYPQLTDELIRRFAGQTFVFVTDELHRSKTDPYPHKLKMELDRRGISYRELSYTDTETLMTCDSTLNVMNEDLVFVPVTPSQDAVRRMFSGLQHVKILRESRHQLALAEGQEEDVLPTISVLGYPEWLLYTHDMVDYFYDLNVYMFSKVYVNPFDAQVKQFYADFKYWYAKEPMSIIPKYGILGYDLGKFFLSALSRYGQHMEARLDGELGESLQTVLSFVSDGKGHYNHGLYLVHFTNESTIDKIVIK